MSSSALSIAVSALRAHTYAIETTSNNVANAATPGYRRQRVELRNAYPREGALGPMGAGVEAKSISRATDRLAMTRWVILVRVRFTTVELRYARADPSFRSPRNLS